RIPPVLLRDVCARLAPGAACRGSTGGTPGTVGADAIRFGIRFCHRRGRFGRLRSGEPTERRSGEPGSGYRSRREGHKPVDPYPGRVLPQHLSPEDHLAVRDGTSARTGWPPHLLAARQGPGRLLVDQRPDLYPRPTPRFRLLAPARQYRLVL